jgi:2-methylcitrate dehydratase PrpD
MSAQPPTGQEEPDFAPAATEIAYLAALYDSLRTREYSDSTRAAAKAAILDGLGCILVGTPTETARIVRQTIAEFGGLPQASILGTRARSSITQAAMANGVAGHVIDYDDTNSSMIGHPSTVLVPVILAVGEAHARSGDDLVRAYIVGFEIETQLGRWMNPRHYGTGWHATSSLGIFGAAAAACHLLRLDAERFVTAVGIAASCASGLRRNFGSMTKSFHAGHAAERGIWAAVLASKGYTATPDPLAGDEGFLAMYRAPEGRFQEQLKAGTPRALELDTVGIGVKPYPCCGAGLTAIDAMLDLCAAHRPDPTQVQVIACTVSRFARQIMPFDSTADELQAKYCLPYCLAVALLDGRAGLRQFEPRRVRAADVQAMMARVQLAYSDTLPSAGGRFGVQLRLSMRDGRALDIEVDTPRGHPARPLSRRELEAKFVECATATLGQTAAHEAAAHIGNLDQLADLAPLILLLRPD